MHNIYIYIYIHIDIWCIYTYIHILYLKLGVSTMAPALASGEAPGAAGALGALGALELTTMGKFRSKPCKL